MNPLDLSKAIMKKKAVSVLAASLLTVTIAACGSSGSGTSSTTTANGSAASSTTSAATAKSDSDSGEGYKICWSTIYLTPSWMQETSGMMDDRIEYWKEKGKISSYDIANANGDTSTQISQIENCIAKGYDAIILDAGSSDALNEAVRKAVDAGIVVVNFDSLVTEEKITCTIGTSSTEYGEQCANWMAEKLNGKGNIIMFSGPAGVAVSDERQKGAEDALKNYPDINVITTLNSEYNAAPAMETLSPVLDANSDVDGILALGGSLASASLTAVQDKGMEYIPITGENYNGFLKSWADAQKDGFSSFAVCQPNWMGVLSIDQCIRILDGEDYDQHITIPLPTITDDNLSDFVPNDQADDWYPIKDITQEEIDKYLTPSK